MAFWLFLAATIVASLTFVSVIVWAEARRRERQEYYRFEFRKRLVEDGKMDAASFASLMRNEHELGLRQGREKLMVAAFVFVGVGIGACIGLQFIGNSVWKLGFLPISIGLSMLVYGFLFAAKPNPEPDQRG
jgi:hypothetical protein